MSNPFIENRRVLVKTGAENTEEEGILLRILEHSGRIHGVIEVKNGLLIHRPLSSIRFKHAAIK
jgi:hypothetical protein